MAGGVAGGLAGGGSNHAAEVGAGVQAGKNAVENNRLTLPQMKRSADELAECMANYGCSTADVMAKWAKIAIEQELEYQKGSFSAPKEYAKDIAIPVWEAANHPVDTIGNAWTYTTDALVHPIENWDKLSTFKFVIAPYELITKPIQARVENIGRYYLGNGGKDASYNAGVESGKLAIDVGSLFIGVGEVGGLRAGTAGAEKAASAVERVGLESAETAASAANADRMAAEASVATDSSPKITITGTEPVKPLTNGGAPYVNAKQAEIGESLAQQSVSSHTSSWPEMRAQFEDKKLPPTDFKMTVNGKVLGSISDPGKGAAIFKVGGKKDVEDVFKTMTGATEMPEPIFTPKGIIYRYALEDGAKVALRNFAKSDTGAQWTLDFAKIPDAKVSRMEIKLMIDDE